MTPSLRHLRGWLQRWKKRNNVGIRRGTNEAQKLPQDYAEQIEDFIQQVRRKRNEHDYTLYNIANMDQTMARFDMPANEVQMRYRELVIFVLPVVVGPKKASQWPCVHQRMELKSLLT